MSTRKQVKVSYKYKVSIIVPCYNTKPWLDECLQSLVNQTLQNIEIICVNDGSTDGTSEKLDEWQAQYPNKIKVIHQQNGGSSNARNTGMTTAHGECISFVDSDDFVDVCMYEKAYQVLKNNCADIVMCGCAPFTDGEDIEIVKKNNTLLNIVVESTNPAMEYLNKSYFSCCFLHKQEYLQKKNIKFEPNIRFLEDIIFGYDIVVCDPIILRIKEQLYFYRRKRQGQHTENKGKKLFDIFKIYKYLYKRNNSNIKLYNKYNNILLKQKVNFFTYFIKQLDIKYRLEFFYKYSYFLFRDEKIVDVYKYALSRKYTKIIYYILGPILLISLHSCYILQNILFNKTIK